MPAKTQLKELLDGFGQETEAEEIQVSPAKSVKAEKTDDKVPPSRRGKRHISGYFEPEVLRQVKILCAEEEKTVNQVLADALNSLFVNKGKAPIA